MNYVSGAFWHVTHAHGKTITWITDGDSNVGIGVVSVLDPDRSHLPAERRVDGLIEPMEDAPNGLVSFGRHHWNRPALDDFRVIAPEYAPLADAIEQRTGVTHYNITQDNPDPFLDITAVAAQLKVKPATIHSYRSRGEMPLPDAHVGRSPVWRTSTVANWTRSGRGTRTDLRK